jgi:hypothetical protein
VENISVETSKPGGKFLSWLWPAAAFFPALVPLIAIILYGVDIPFGDEWDIAGPLFYKLSNHTLTFADIIAQHNEHRIAVTRLIILAIGKLTHYNVKAEMFVTWAVACIISLLVYRLGQRTLFAQRAALRFWSYAAWFLSNLMIFHLIQYENWLWGMEVHFFLPTLCLLSAALALVSGLPRWLSIPIAILMSVLSTYSAANGMILWIVLIPLTRRAGKSDASLIIKDIWTVCWIICAILTIWSYFHGYIKPPQHPSLLEALKHPLQFILYFLVYLGSPLGPGTELTILPQSIAVGIVVTLLYVGTLLYAWHRRQDQDLAKRALPWLTLGAYVVATALVTDFARLGFGFDEAIASRYNTISGMMYVSLIYLIPMFCRDALEFYTTGLLSSLATIARPLPAVLAGGMMALYIPCSYVALGQCVQFGIRRANGQAALMFIDFFPDEALVNRTAGSTGQIPVVKQWADFLNTLGYVHPPLAPTTDIKNFEAPDQKGLTPEGKDFYGQIEMVIPVANGQWGIQGWAVFPKHKRPARAVLLTYQIGTADPQVWGVGDAGQPRPDIALQTGVPAYADAGFVKTFPPTSIPKGDLKIQAWALDLSTLKAYGVSNPVTIHNGP